MCVLLQSKKELRFGFERCVTATDSARNFNNQITIFDFKNALVVEW